MNKQQAREAIAAAFNALKVIELTPGIVEHLQKTDPKALEQVQTAADGLLLSFPDEAQEEAPAPAALDLDDAGAMWYPLRPGERTLLRRALLHYDRSFRIKKGQQFRDLNELTSRQREDAQRNEA